MLKAFSYTGKKSNDERSATKVYHTLTGSLLFHLHLTANKLVKLAALVSLLQLVGLL